MVGKNIHEHAEAVHYEILAPSRNELNLLSSQSAHDYLQRSKPDLIIHSAGRVGGIQANMKNPVSFLVENLDMGRNILLAAREAKVTNFLNLASSCMYPRNAESPLTEDLILKGELEPTNEGYALAKIAIMKLCQYLQKEDSHLKYKTIVPCNLYGRWDKFSPEHSHMVPAVISKIHAAKSSHAKTVEIWGDGTARREFMFTGDLADLIFRAVSRFDQLPEVMNVGLGQDYSILEYYQAIAEVIGFQGEFSFDLSKPIGMKRKMVDVQLQTAFGWKPKISLKQGILKTYQFYLENIL